MNQRLLSAALTGLLGISAAPAPADAPPVPGDGFPPSRYETLWTKSPFAVATPEAAAGSPDYQLVGIARFDGVSYASLIETQSQQHFLLSSETPARGLTLISITRGQGSSGNQAVVQKDGQPITLVQDTSNSGPVAMSGPPPNAMPQPLPMPGAGGAVFTQPPMPPPFRRRLPFIRLPPNPAQVAPPPAPTSP
jgi:hypothetical protein